MQVLGSNAFQRTEVTGEQSSERHMVKNMKSEELERLNNMLTYERALSALGYKCVCGVDEAGRGPLAGEVFAAAVILPEGYILEGLNDSKKLSEKKREALFEIIKEDAVAWSVSTASVDEIDEINIRNATYLAMRRAIFSLKVPADYALIDGDCITELTLPHQCVIKGDANSLSIAAASILAKVSRDRYMKEQALLYPQYQFEKHKGYGTALHTQLLKEYGPCPIHRRTFLKNILKEDEF